MHTQTTYKLSHDANRCKVWREPALMQGSAGCCRGSWGRGTAGDTPTAGSKTTFPSGEGGMGEEAEGSWRRAGEETKLRLAPVPKSRGRPERRFHHLDVAPASGTGPLRGGPCAQVRSELQREAEHRWRQRPLPQVKSPCRPMGAGVGRRWPSTCS